MNKKKINIGQIGLHVYFILICATYILPFILILSVSFSDESALKSSGFSLFPKIFSTAAYELAFANVTQLIRSYEVTIVFSMATTGLAILLSGMMAYAMSRPYYRFRKLITFMAFFTILFQGGLVPSYIINTKYLGLGDSILIYILPSIISAWNLIVMRTNFQQIPSSLIESAKMDGASEIRICFQIVFPLSLPVMATIGFLTFVGKWNDWFTTSVYIRSLNLYSLQFLLQRILTELEFVKQMEQLAGPTLLFSTENLPTESFRFAMAVLAAGPVLLFFPFFQKYFSKGLTIGAVKG